MADAMEHLPAVTRKIIRQIPSHSLGVSEMFHPRHVFTIQSALWLWPYPLTAYMYLELGRIVLYGGICGVSC